jgi:peptidoglycan hydrolase-like protein with peptidoglycan-binding domain
MQEGKDAASATPAVGTASRNGGHKGWVITGIVLALLIAGGAIWWVLGSNGDEEAVATDETSLAEVVLTDVEQAETLDGTLGYPEGEPIGSGMSGTLTLTTPAGTVVSEGDVLYEIEGHPVVLLQGDLPAWQSMGLEQVTLAIKAAGTVTWLPAVGTTLQQGDVVAKVNEVPIVLLYGDLPLYESLQYGSAGPLVQQLEASLVAMGYDPDGTITVDEDFDWATYLIVQDWQEAVGLDDDGQVSSNDVVITSGPITVSTLTASVGASSQGSLVIAQCRGDSGGSEGADVEQLEAALSRLGFDPGPIDGTYTTDTQAAVLAWQASVGADTDGVVDLGEIVFRPEPVRISDNPLAVGDNVAGGTAVLGASSNALQVTVALPADEQDLLGEGDRVVVVLPDNTEVAGTVTFVASVATRNTTSMEVTFEVLVTLDDLAAVEDLDEAPVEIKVVTEAHTGVMAVPVTALLALSEGGYAVEVDNGDGTTRLAPVEPGLYADGLVEVSSTALQAGDMVVVP